jgi:hypothetical protein
LRIAYSVTKKERFALPIFKIELYCMHNQRNGVHCV